MARAELSYDAERDLVEIGLWIVRESGSWETTSRFVDRITDTCRLLATQPESGELRTEFRTGLYRSFTVGNYVIYFRPSEDGIWVAPILHGARDHEAIL
jgi:toxin ParE1/3/4